MRERKTGFLWHERYMWHAQGSYAGVMPAAFPLQPGEHSEHPETKRRIKNLLDASGFSDHLIPLKPRTASDQELQLVHTPEYVAKVRQLSEDRGGECGFVAPILPGGFDIAALGVGGCLVAVEAVMGGEVDNAYALVRPPGHHAEPDQGKGFCIFANAALAGRHALDGLGARRVAFVDWDVHHGNGTQAVFWRDPRALTISIHQDRAFPLDSGMLDEVGEGPGEGFNLNVPLPPGCGRGAYLEVMKRIVSPALRAFQPDLIIVCCGLDAGAHDPLGSMMLYSTVYRQMMAGILDDADAVCGGRVLAVHEGGYNRWTAPFDCLAVLEAMSGRSAGFESPYLPLMENMGQQDLQPHQDAFIKTVEAHCQALVPRWTRQAEAA